MILDDFKQSEAHVLQYMKLDTLCRRKIIDLVQWLYSPEWKYNIISYQSNEYGIRFSVALPGDLSVVVPMQGDHFLYIRYGKKCAELQFYNIPHNHIKDYMKFIDKSNFRIRINGGDIDRLPIEEIKDNIKMAYYSYIDHLKISTNKLNDSKKEENQSVTKTNELGCLGFAIGFFLIIILTFLICYVLDSIFPRSFLEALPGLFIVLVIGYVAWLVFKAWLEWIIP